ncbi:hypothetical protein HDU76_006806 [Blyttiomyces sp. JEL0837]|nr:hypothetical protein HDU76_006806 [Blyttiomyces sp. JEL0837]
MFKKLSLLQPHSLAKRFVTLSPSLPPRLHHQHPLPKHHQNQLYHTTYTSLTSLTSAKSSLPITFTPAKPMISSKNSNLSQSRQIHSKASSTSSAPPQSHFEFDGEKLPILQKSDKPRYIIYKPPASELTEKYLHPRAYLNLQPLKSFSQLANRLGVPLEGLEDICDRVWYDENVQHYFQRLCERSDDTPECQIQSDLSELCTTIKNILATHAKIPRPRTVPHGCVVVGGFMAFPEYDIRSNTDFHVKHEASDRVLFSTVIKSTKAFEPEELWCEESRPTEVLAALYGYNSVVFLVTPKQWKLFVENEERDTILTIPFVDSPEDSHVCGVMGDRFVTALTICLMAPDRTPVNLPIPKFPADVNDAGETIWQEIIVWTQEQVGEMLQREEEERLEKLREEESDDEGYQGSKIERVTGSEENVSKEGLPAPTKTSDNHRRRQLKFAVGVDEFGNTVWRDITVWSREQVDELFKREEEEEERLNKLKKKSKS